MKISKLLNKKNFSIIIIFCFFGLNSLAEDQPVDIWNIDEKESSDNSNNSTSVLENVDENNQLFDSEIYKMQSEKQIDKIELNSTIESKEIKILGLYDPEDYGLSIDMWSNSNGDQLKILFTNLAKLNLSRDAAEIMNISLFTNAYYPNKNISEEEFTNIKSQWLIKNSDYKLIEEYLIKNQIINIHPVLTRYLVDQYLSESNVSKACSIFSKNLEPIKDEYLSKFNLYCLVNDKKK